jgi:hypothetical protein
MQMKITLLAVIAISALVAACEPKLRWHDTTGQARRENTEDADVKACEAQNEPANTSQITAANWEPIWIAIKACMASKGWTPILRGNSN